MYILTYFITLYPTYVLVIPEIPFLQSIRINPKFLDYRQIDTYRFLERCHPILVIDVIFDVNFSFHILDCGMLPKHNAQRFARNITKIKME